ncbi:DUF397 domain-containing protein [Streptomyces sp. NRRL S-495]|uniref:DUF397 domain-containing protein n=1 Tax=Streptomyces sp. NRRL S-495 TaxID=1609133 RepID=UPI0005F94EDC|nr:DUF397 domain-containing protein [Streptomyces sp. NRRL S-495]KJY29286.1 hypothetical protein VR45_30325 [Streptomyces sp. NRRL S-495]
MAAPIWQKSSFSGDAANCIYLAATVDGRIRIRESDEPDVVVTTTAERLRAFICGVKAGEFDHLAL